MFFSTIFVFFHTCNLWFYQALGAWDVSKAVRMTALDGTSKQGSTVWHAVVTLPIPAATQFKFLLGKP
jgi:hypothetical protein